eukprot:496018-Pleurochrysis_carterae.AAC.2
MLSIGEISVSQNAQRRASYRREHAASARRACKTPLGLRNKWQGIYACLHSEALTHLRCRSTKEYDADYAQALRPACKLLSRIETTTFHVCARTMLRSLLLLLCPHFALGTADATGTGLVSWSENGDGIYIPESSRSLAETSTSMRQYQSIPDQHGQSYFADISVTAGVQPQMVRWKLECSGREVVREGLAPLELVVEVFPFESCLLSLFGPERGGWFGAAFSGLGLESVTLVPGGNETFRTVVGAAPSPLPPPPPSAPLSPSAPAAAPTLSPSTPPASPFLPAQRGSTSVRSAAQLRSLVAAALPGETFVLYLQSGSC